MNAKLTELGPAKAVFKGLGRNFMTPDVISYRWRRVAGKLWAVELSEGTGFDHEPIFGVTFRDPDNPGEAEIELSGMFHTKAQALAWYNEGDPEA
jgi:hypothetical protein